MGATGEQNKTQDKTYQATNFCKQEILSSVDPLL